MDTRRTFSREFKLAATVLFRVSRLRGSFQELFRDLLTSDDRVTATDADGNTSELSFAFRSCRNIFKPPKRRRAAPFLGRSTTHSVLAKLTNVVGGRTSCVYRLRFGTPH